MNNKKNCIGVFNGIGATKYIDFLLSIGIDKKDITEMIDRSNKNKPYVVINCKLTSEEFKKVNRYTIENLQDYLM